jgi:hypothetical protein
MVIWKEKKLNITPKKQLNSCLLIMPFVKLSHHQSINHYNMVHKRNEPCHYFSNKLKSVFSSCEAFEQMFMELCKPTNGLKILWECKKRLGIMIAWINTNVNQIQLEMIEHMKHFLIKNHIIVVWKFTIRNVNSSIRSWLKK